MRSPENLFYQILLKPLRYGNPYDYLRVTGREKFIQAGSPLSESQSLRNEIHFAKSAILMSNFS
jgi:hypothetical protein